MPPSLSNLIPRVQRWLDENKNGVVGNNIGLFFEYFPRATAQKARLTLGYEEPGFQPYISEIRAKHMGNDMVKIGPH